MSEHVVSDFKGKDGLLIQSIDSLLEMDAKGILVPHGIGGHARTLLRAAKAAIEQAALTVPEGYVMVPVDLLDRFPELNEFNYSHDDVCELNAWGIDLVLSAAPEVNK